MTSIIAPTKPTIAGVEVTHEQIIECAAECFISIPSIAGDLGILIKSAHTLTRRSGFPQAYRLCPTPVDGTDEHGLWVFSRQSYEAYKRDNAAVIAEWQARNAVKTN